MERNEVIAIVSVVVLLLGFITTLSIESSNKLDLATKAGLEQCPIGGAGVVGEIIFVRSCAEYTELIKNK